MFEEDDVPVTLRPSCSALQFVLEPSYVTCDIGLIIINQLLINRVRENEGEDKTSVFIQFGEKTLKQQALWRMCF